jgi:hypothetical protein
MSSYTAMKLRYFNFKQRQKKTVVIKKFLEVFRGGKTETIIKDLIFVQSFGHYIMIYNGMPLHDSVKTQTQVIGCLYAPVIGR